MSKRVSYIRNHDDQGGGIALVHQAVYENGELLYLAVIARGPDLAAIRRAVLKRRPLFLSQRLHGSVGMRLHATQALASRAFQARRPLPSGYTHLVLAPKAMLATSGEQRFFCLVPDGMPREEALVRQLNRRFPVPIHPSWAAALYADLEAEGHVRELKAIGTEAIACDVDPLTLARLVSKGVRTRHYPRVPREEPRGAPAVTDRDLSPPRLAAALAGGLPA